ncbi:MAG: ribonuclease HI [Desulfobacteraceae bacterium]|nr:ribonuclease HI [Desulfobacteraceae bacterium]MCB9494639.1 ribonuclease HI [Desulfobacteraceae bacterium]
MSKKKWYAVLKGKKPGIYESWFGENGAKVQIDGFKGAVFKGFLSLEEAEDFICSPKKNNLKVPEVDLADNDFIVVYTDGGCINNPGPGGFGAVIIENGKIKELSGGKRLTTNNRMEMTACIEALKYLKKASKKIILHTDSAYIANAVNKGWLNSWIKKNWVKSDGKPVLNPDLWKQIYEYLQILDVEIKWVKGHAGIKYNERCDVLANSNARNNPVEVDAFFENNMNNEKN